MSDYNRVPDHYSHPYGDQPTPQGDPQPFPPGYEPESPYPQQDPYGYSNQPYPPQPYAQQSYVPNSYVGSPQYYGAPLLPEPPNASAVLVLGILGIAVVGITAPFAWWQGNKARRGIRQGLYRESGSVTAGWILGIVGTVLLAIPVMLLILYLFFVVVAYGIIVAS